MNVPLRILQVGPVPPEAGGSTAGGVATHVWDVARGLSKRGHEVAVLADNLAGAGIAPMPATVDGITLLPALSASWVDLVRSVSRPASAAGFAGCLVRWGQDLGIREIARAWPGYIRSMRWLRPDLVHVHHLERRFPVALRAAGSRIPVVATVHSTHSVEDFAGDGRFSMRRLIARNYRVAGDVIFVSRFVRERFAWWFGPEPGRGRAWTVYNGVDPELFRPVPRVEARARIGLKGDEPVIMFAGSLIARKRADVLLAAAGILKRRGRRFRVIVVGDGPDRGALEAQARALKIEESVAMVGTRAQDELVYFYNSADLFVFPSLMESFGLVFIEAMLCGCAVIGCADVLDELLGNGLAGVRVPPDDPAGLADAIETGLSRSWNRVAIREHARAFDRDTALDRLEEVYHSVLDDSCSTDSVSAAPHVRREDVPGMATGFVL